MFQQSKHTLDMNLSFTCADTLDGRATLLSDGAEILFVPGGT